MLGTGHIWARHRKDRVKPAPRGRRAPRSSPEQGVHAWRARAGAGCPGQATAPQLRPQLGRRGLPRLRLRSPLRGRCPAALRERGWGAATGCGGAGGRLRRGSAGSALRAQRPHTHAAWPSACHRQEGAGHAPRSQRDKLMPRAGAPGMVLSSPGWGGRPFTEPPGPPTRRDPVPRVRRSPGLLSADPSPRSGAAAAQSLPPLPKAVRGSPPSRRSAAGSPWKARTRG